MIESFSIAVRLLSIQNDKIANSMLEEYGMTNGQFKVLNLLYARPAFSLRQVDIEEFFQISNPTVTVILNSLEKKGLVERRINPSDSRSKLIGVTEKAEEMFNGAFAGAAEDVAGWAREWRKTWEKK